MSAALQRKRRRDRPFPHVDHETGPQRDVESRCERMSHRDGGLAGRHHMDVAGLAERRPQFAERTNDEPRGVRAGESRRDNGREVVA